MVGVEQIHLPAGIGEVDQAHAKAEQAHRNGAALPGFFAQFAVVGQGWLGVLAFDGGLGEIEEFHLQKGVLHAIIGVEFLQPRL